MEEHLTLLDSRVGHNSYFKGFFMAVSFGAMQQTCINMIGKYKIGASSENVWK